MGHEDGRKLSLKLGGHVSQIAPCLKERVRNKVYSHILRWVELPSGRILLPIGVVDREKHAEITIPAAGVQYPPSFIESSHQAVDLVQEMPVIGNIANVVKMREVIPPKLDRVSFCHVMVSSRLFALEPVLKTDFPL